jgi:hypothetical protein
MRYLAIDYHHHHDHNHHHHRQHQHQHQQRQHQHRHMMGERRRQGEVGESERWSDGDAGQMAEAGGIHTGRWTDRQTDRQRDRQIDRDIDDRLRACKTTTTYNFRAVWNA